MEVVTGTQVSQPPQRPMSDAKQTADIAHGSAQPRCQNERHFKYFWRAFIVQQENVLSCWKKWSENRKVFIRNLFILLFWLYLIVTLTRLKFLSVLESSPMKWRRTDMFTFLWARGMNNLRRKRCLIKFDEEKSVLTFYQRQSVFVRCYQLRYRCLCIPRHTRCTDNQASACVCIHFFVWNDDCVVIESMYVSQWEKRVSQDDGFV